MIVDTDIGLFGPYTSVQVLDDRLLCDGAELPFTVIGAYSVIDPTLPDGFYAPNYTWDGAELAPSAPPAALSHNTAE